MDIPAGGKNFLTKKQIALEFSNKYAII